MSQNSGTELIKSHLVSTPTSPGVYQMKDAEGKLLYVGKAKNLKKRLSSYARPDLPLRTARMVFATRALEYRVTASEAEALLLEASLVRKLQPKYNILLKDDKSFPYIKMRLDHEFPQLLKYRGKSLTDGKYFGPFASVSNLEATLAELQKIFKLRSCSDHYFATRRRPCLLYQIKRCTAPCVGKISKEDYDELTSEVLAFLRGKTQELQSLLAGKMQKLSSQMRFEEAAIVRDRIKALSYIQLKAGAHKAAADADVIAVSGSASQYVIEVFFYRSGQGLGNRAYFPSHTQDASSAEVLSSFIGQFYQTKQPPKEIILSERIEDLDVVADALRQLYGTPVKIVVPAHKGSKLDLVKNALANAEAALEQYQKNSAKNLAALQAMQELFNLPDTLERVEVYDNSHIMGAFAVGAMVVVTPTGFDKKEYRTYNVESRLDAPTPLGGDDYYMLRQVMTRRLLKAQQKPEKAPDLMIIDGGKGHMSVVLKVMEELAADIPFVCMAKGPNRDAGREQFHMPGREVFTLDKNDSLMKYLQILRDEAHNFAIKSHRQKRSRAIKFSSLDELGGIGKARKQTLLNYFGSYEAIKGATAIELSKVPGISKTLAKNIFTQLHRS